MSVDDSDALRLGLAGLRLRRHEAQLTQFMAAVASADDAFAAALAGVLVRNAPAPENFSPPVGADFAFPDALVCRAEERVWDMDATSQGYVDLLFRTPTAV